MVPDDDDIDIWRRDTFMMNALRDELMTAMIKFLIANKMSDGKSISPDGLVIALGASIVLKQSVRANLTHQGSKEEAIDNLEKYLQAAISPEPREYGTLDPVTGRLKKTNEQEN